MQNANGRRGRARPPKKLAMPIPLLSQTDRGDRLALEAPATPSTRVARGEAPTERPSPGPTPRDAVSDDAPRHSLEPEPTRRGNPNLVLLWFALPFVAVILWQLLFERGGP